MNVERFANLPPQNRGIYGATFNNNNSPRLTVCINPELDDYNRELFAFHEFNHVIMDGNIERVVSSIGSMSPDVIAQVQDGFCKSSCELNIWGFIQTKCNVMDVKAKAFKGHINRSTRST